MALTKHPARAWALVGQALADTQYKFLHKPSSTTIHAAVHAAGIGKGGAPGVSATNNAGDMNDKGDNEEDAGVDTRGSLQSPRGALHAALELQSVAGSGGTTDVATQLKNIITVRVWGVGGDGDDVFCMCWYFLLV